MEKKFDFKTIFIACLLFFGFVFLLFYKFSSADDSINHYKTALEIFDNEQSFEDFKSILPNKILPDWYTESESAANMLQSLACFCMGDYIGVSEGLVSELSGQITGDPLFLEHFVFDFDSLCWVFDSGTSDFIKTKLEPHIYNTPSDSIGYWVPLPVTVNYNSRSRLVRHSDTFTGQAYITSTGVFNGNYHYLVAYKGDLISGPTYWVQYTGDFTCGSFYNGSFDSGYYNDIAGAQMTSSSFSGSYSSPSDALADFFGNQIGGEPSLIEGVSIRNDDFVVKPLSYPASVMVDYPNEITYPDYDPDDSRLTFEYTYNMEVPFWLKNPTTEPTSFELPTDYDFGNIDFEYDADPSYLAGAGIVQDVFEVLPASLQGLILLFGAGSLAFIFLRR